MTIAPTTCVREMRHRWDAGSGWCVNGCGWRDDGQSSYRPYMPMRADHVDITEPRRTVD